MSGTQHDYRWNVRGFKRDGSTVLYPVGQYKRAARQTAADILRDSSELHTAAVVDGWEEFDVKDSDVFLGVDSPFIVSADGRIVYEVAEVVADFFASYAPLAKPSTTEDGAVTHPASAEDIAEAMRELELTNPDNAGERIALGSLIAELAPADYVTTTEAAAVLSWVRDWAADCQWGDVDAESMPLIPDAEILRRAHRHISGGLGFVLEDVRRVDADARRPPAMLTEPEGSEDEHEAMRMDMRSTFDRQLDSFADRQASAVARIAKEAAEAFEYDEDREDAETAAQRAADILRDLSPDDRPAFLVRIFGVPAEDRFATVQLDHYNRRGANPAEVSREVLRELRTESLKERGLRSIASELVRNYEDVIEAAAFPVAGCTNWNAWNSARAALRAVVNLGNFTYGGGPLDSRSTDKAIETMALDCREHMIEAVRYAAHNQLHAADAADMREEGMPRAE